jgi:hypothetical protein
MTMFRVRDERGDGGKNDDFEIRSVRLIGAQTGSFIAKTVTVGAMIALTLAVIVLAARGESAQLTATVGGIGNLLSFLLGRYFDKGKDG